MGNIDKIVSLAKMQGISLSSLCARIGKTRSYLSEIASRHRNVPDEYIPELAAALHTTPAYLMGETDDPSPETKKEPAGMADGLTEDKRFLIECTMNMSDENVRKLRAIVEQVFLERGE